MKSLLIFTAFTSSALASAIQLPNLLMGRVVNPATMNPTMLSVLSVLKTGMPTGPSVPMPTGDFEPDWYQKLPEDVKSLLPSFYPVTPMAQAVVAATTSESQVVSQVSVVESSVATLTSTSQSEGVFSMDTVLSASASTATITPLPSSSAPSTESASQTAFSATLASASATSSSSLSTGARFAVKIETLALIALSSVGAAFCIFA